MYKAGCLIAHCISQAALTEVSHTLISSRAGCYQ